MHAHTRANTHACTHVHTHTPYSLDKRFLNSGFSNGAPTFGCLGRIRGRPLLYEILRVRRTRGAGSLGDVEDGSKLPSVCRSVADTHGQTLTKDPPQILRESVAPGWETQTLRDLLRGPNTATLSPRGHQRLRV